MKNIFKKFVHDSVCPAVKTTEMDICVPISIRGVADVGEVSTICQGPPKIIPNTDHCPGKRDNVFNFVIRQKLKVEVPVKFGAKTVVGEHTVHFEEKPCEAEHECDDGCEHDCDCECDCDDDIYNQGLYNAQRHHH